MWNMRRKRENPPAKTQHGYNLPGAANPNGSAARLLAPALYIIDPANIGGIISMRAFAFGQARLFLLRLISDKPSRRGLPRCRSPPAPVCFLISKKQIGGKANA